MCPPIPCPACQSSISNSRKVDLGIFVVDFFECGELWEKFKSMNYSDTKFSLLAAWKDYAENQLALVMFL